MARTITDDDGPGNRDSQSVAEKRREQIVNSAITLFSERGYFQTTIEDISNDINVGKGLIYRYFKDKNDVLFYALCVVLEKYKKEDIVQLVGKVGPLAALKKVLRIKCSIAQEHTLEVILAYRSTKDLLPEQRHQIKEIELGIAGGIKECLEACIKAGFMVPVDTDIMAYQYIIYGDAWALKNWAFRDKCSASEYLAEGEKLLIWPFLTELGREEFKKIEKDGAVSWQPSTARRRKNR